MKRRRWRRSTEAKLDENQTNSILHIPGLLVHVVTRVQKKTSDSWKVSTDRRGVFRVVNGHVKRGFRLGCTADSWHWNIRSCARFWHRS